MKFYYFGGVFQEGNPASAHMLEKNNFSGVMYTYDPTEGDMFTRVAREIKTEGKIKYLVAIRPYTISPQYLYTISQSISEIAPDRLQINVVPGYIKDHEKNIGGILGEVNDLSESLEKSKYTIEFIKKLDEINNGIMTTKTGEGKQLENTLDVYISTTNSYVFDAVKKFKNKIILPYHIYGRGFWSDVLKDPSLMIPFEREGTEIMLAMTPIIRETKKELESLTQHAMRPVWKKGEIPVVVSDVEYFTYDSFHEFVQTLEENNIHHLLINAVPRSESEIIISFINQYVELQK